MTMRWTAAFAALLAFGSVASQARAEDVPKLIVDTQGFTAMVNSLDLSPGGELLAAAGTDKVVRVWDLRTGKLAQTLRGYDGKGAEGFCQAVAFSPDGKNLLVGVQDYTTEGAIRVYDVGHLDEIQALLPGHASNGVARLSFSADGKYLASVGPDGEVLLWDWPARRQIGTVRVEGGVSYLGFPSRVPMLVGYDAKGFHAWSVKHAKEVFRLTPQESAWLGDPTSVKQAIDEALALGRVLGSIAMPYQGQVNSNRTYPELGYALVGGRGKKAGRDTYWVGLWSTRDGRRFQVFEEHRFTPSALALSADGTLAASADVLGDLYVWETRTGRQRNRFTAKGRPIYKVAFDSTGNRLAFGTKPLGPDRWGFNSYAESDQTFDLAKRQIDDAAPGEHQGEQTRLGGRVLGLLFQAPQYVLTSTLNGAPESRYPFPSGINPMCYTLLRSKEPGFDGPIVVGRNDNAIVCKDPRTMMGRREFIGHQGAVNSLSETPDGRLLASGSDDRTVRLWSLGGFRQDAWPDFDSGSDSVVTYLIPGGESERAGIRLGDRVVKMDGKDLGYLAGEYLAGRWAYRAGQPVVIELVRNGQPLAITVPLVPTGDFTEPVLSLFMADGEWVLWTPQGFYDASPQGDRLIGWHVNQGRAKAAKFYLVEQFRKQFYRPDIIDRVLKTGDVPRAIADANAARSRPVRVLDLRKPGALAKIEPPRIKLLEPADGAKVGEPRITVSGLVESQNDLPLGEVKILVNGRPVSGKSIVRGIGDNERRRTIDREIDLFPGRNTITIFAANRAATSRPATVRVFCNAPPKPQPRKVRLLAVGISEYRQPDFKLEFAHRDAQDFARAWETQRGGLYAEVESRVLTNKEATAAAIRDGMDWIKTGVTMHDLAVLFISAHGIADDDGGYYIASHEVDPRRLTSTAIPSTDLIRLVEGLRCKAMVFLDTCHGGGILGANVPQDDSFRDLVSEEVGALMFGSSTPRGLSQESPKWKHGAFTKAILETVADRSNYDDGLLSVLDLALQIDRRVKKLTANQQHPVNKIPPNIDNFTFFKYVDGVSSIGLRSSAYRRD